MSDTVVIVIIFLGYSIICKLIDLWSAKHNIDGTLKQQENELEQQRIQQNNQQESNVTSHAVIGFKIPEGEENNIKNK